jgi:hypothetical protein
MQLLHCGDANSLFIQYGQDIPVIFPEDKECWSVDRSQSTFKNHDELKKELLELLHHVRIETGYSLIYLYGNFDAVEIQCLRELSQALEGWNIDITASVQDDSVPDGQIIIEEIR